MPTETRVLTPPSPLTIDSVVQIYVVVNPGIESVVEAELRNFLSHDGEALKTLATSKGGIELRARLGDVIDFQPKLKSATRVMLRVAEFVAKDFPKLFKKTEELPWHAWIKPTSHIEWRATSHQSRLRIKKRIESVAGDAVESRRRRGQGKLKTTDGATVADDGLNGILGFIRVQDDVVTLSLDLSGELLHKRGDRSDVGLAPLRETWASAVVTRAVAHIEKSSEKGSSGPWTWIEPMAGTAIFAREYLRAYRGAAFDQDSSETEARSFAVVEHLKIGGLKKQTSTGNQQRGAEQTILFSRFFILDRDPEQLRRAAEGLKPYREREGHFGFRIELNSGGVLSNDSQPRFIVVNPPWGVRLKDGAVDSVKKQSALFEELDKKYAPTFVACVVPRVEKGASDSVERLRLPKGWKQVDAMEFKSGGIAVRALFFRIGS